ncbi:hypothetical protein [Pseudonocardia xishanensis]|uniref:HNH endonuclease n=1 Tax=Pseudonocardia xishanensis TaxID=630995 RepID=A0ABP8RYT5_9PSEU
MGNRVTARPCRIAGCPELAERVGRCPAHAAELDRHQRRTTPTKVTRTSAEQRRRARVVAQHRRVHGDWCPGFEVEAHQSSDLTADHVVSVADAGHGRGPLAVLCRSCNSRKNARSQHSTDDVDNDLDEVTS